MPRAALALVPAALAACVPVVTHGPRVEPGYTAGAVAAVSTQPILERELEHGGGSVSPVLPPTAVFARVGWTPESSGSAVPFSAGVLFPVAGPFALLHPEADLYAQLLARPGSATAGGAGLLLSPSYAAPYLQLGREVDGGLGVYTTQSLARFAGRGVRGTVWMPAAAVRMGGVHLWAQGGLGRERLEEPGTPPRSRPVRFLMGGITAESPRSRRR